MKVKRRSFGERPNWAPRQVDATVAQVHPLPGWVLLEEIFPVERVGELEIVRSLTRNTVLAEILAVHGDTARELGVTVGEQVILREWAGGRWAFGGQSTLLTESVDILARVTPD